MGTYLTDSLYANEENPIIRILEEDYAIENDEILIAAKRRLTAYVLNKENGKRWDFISDKQWEAEKQKKAEKQTQIEIVTQSEVPQQETETITDITSDKVVKLEGVLIKAIDPQLVLRKLRSGYLHWSATREGVGMDPYTDKSPEKNRVRKQF